jgi:hypothetical protein
MPNKENLYLNLDLNQIKQLNSDESNASPSNVEAKAHNNAKAKKSVYQKSGQHSSNPYFSNHQLQFADSNPTRKSALNSQNNLQRYLTRRSKKLLKNIQAISAYNNELARIGEENFIFLNTRFDKSPVNSHQSQYHQHNNGHHNHGVSLSVANLLASGQSLSSPLSMSLNNLDSKCRSNVGVYPKPSRSSSHMNRFNVTNPEQEATCINGSLYY